MMKLTIQAMYEQYKSDVYGYVFSLTHSKPLSEDLTSEVFLAAMQALPGFRGESGIKTWLFSIARYKWYEYLRRSKRQLDPEELMRLYWREVAEPESDLVTQEVTERIYELLALEPARNREVVLLRVEGYSYFEIAGRHGISESSARVIDFRTKAKIRAALRKEGLNDA